MNFKFFVFGLIVLSLFSGCREVALHHNLEEMEAGEILAALHQHGIDAQKEKEISGQDVSWTVMVAEKDLPQSRQILISNNLPHKQALGLSGVYKDKGLIPTPDEQKARFLLAMKGEIINSLSKIPGVIDVDVVLNIPQENELTQLDPEKQRPTASVVIRTRNDEVITQTLTEGKLQRFVANTVPKLDPNDVVVIITRSETGLPPASNAVSPVLPSSPVSSTMVAGLAVLGGGGEVVEIAGVRMDPESVGRFKGYIIGLLVLLLAVSVYLLYNIVRLNRMRLKVQRASRPTRASLEGGQPQGYLGDGGQGGVAGTFDVNANQRQG